jgi:formate-dependent phosphoribosylglycinamide formyltransferase (GAR transformylase)
MARNSFILEFVMKMTRTWLLLGGGGLICGEIAERLNALGDKVFSLDFRQQPGIEAAHSYTGDALAPGVLDRFLAEVKPDGIINGINLATIFAREPAQGYASLVAYICSIHDALRDHLRRREGDSRRPMHGAVRNAVGIRFGAFSENMKVSFQATRSIG